MNRKDFIPVPQNVVMNMDLQQAKEYLEEIKVILAEIKNEKTQYIADHQAELVRQPLNKTVLRLNVERNKFVKYYKQVEDRLVELKKSRKDDEERSVRNFLFFFCRESKKILDEQQFNSIVQAAANICPVPNKIKGLVYEGGQNEK